MKSETIYILKSVISMSIFFSIYWLAMRKQTFFRVNRFYLLSSLLLSLVLPALKIPQSPIANMATIDKYILLKEITINGSNPAASIFNFISIFLWIYISIAGVLAVRFAIQLAQIAVIYFKSEKAQFRGLPLMLNSKVENPFSFFNLIFISSTKLTDKESTKILAHELTHIRQLHSIDIIVLEILCILLWFNPLVWLYRKALKEIHEYLADEGVVEQGYDSGRYRLLLYQSAIGENYLQIANNFNYSLIKKRLAMMTRQKSSRWAAARLLVTIPAIILLVHLFSNSDASAKMNSKIAVATIQINSAKAGIESSIPAKSTLVSNQKSVTNLSSTKQIEGVKDSIIFEIVEEMPEFPGGQDSLRGFLAKNIKYPAEARKKGITGKTYIRFVVNSEGNVANVEVARGANQLLDEEGMRVVKLLPKWKPGVQKGKPVSVWYTVPINFALSK